MWTGYEFIQEHKPHLSAIFFLLFRFQKGVMFQNQKTLQLLAIVEASPVDLFLVCCVLLSVPNQNSTNIASTSPFTCYRNTAVQE